MIYNSKRIHLSKSFIFVLTATFLLVLGTYVSGTILTPFAQSMGATWFEIGILSCSMYIIRLVFGTPIGRLSDKKGALKMLKYSLILYPFIAVAYYLAFNMGSLIAARLFHGVASAMMLPMGMAYVGEISPQGEEGRYMSLYNLIVILASGTGPVISTVIAGHFGYKSAFAVLFALALMALVSIQYAVESKGEKTAEAVPAAGGGRKRTTVKLGNRNLLALGFANISLSVVSSLVGFFMIPYLKAAGMELEYTGFIIAVYYIVSGGIQVPAGKLIDRHNKFALILLTGFGTAAALAVFPLSGGIVSICFCMMLTALGAASFQTAVSSLSIVAGRRLGMGSTMGFLSTANSIGMIFGSITLSLLPGSGQNFEQFFYFSGAVMAISTLLFAVFWNKSSETADKASENYG